jgi:hypothetical protein
MNLTGCVCWGVCVFIAVVALRLQWTWESRVAQCELEQVSCVQLTFQFSTCQQWHAECLQTLKDHDRDVLVVVVGCCTFTGISFLIDYCAKYDDYIQLAEIGAFQLYRAYQWGEKASILGIEVMIMACRLWLGKCSRIAPLAQWFCIFFMLFGTEDGFSYWNRQTRICRAEVFAVLVWLGYDALKIFFRQAPVHNTRPPSQKKNHNFSTKVILNEVSKIKALLRKSKKNQNLSTKVCTQKRGKNRSRSPARGSG